MRAAPSWILLCLGLTFALALPAQAERAIRYLLFMTGPNEGFSPHRPERITPEAFRELLGNFEGLPPSHIEAVRELVAEYTFDSVDERSRQ